MWWTSQGRGMKCKPSPQNISFSDFTNIRSSRQEKFDITTSTEKFGYYIVMRSDFNWSVWSKCASDCSLGVTNLLLKVSKPKALKNDNPKADIAKSFEKWRADYNHLADETLSKEDFSKLLVRHKEDLDSKKDDSK